MKETDTQPQQQSAMSTEAATILVIDDEESLRFSFTNFLEQEGYRVFAAAGMQPALELLAAQAVDVVFCDIVLPEGSGVEMLGRIKGMGLACPVVMITGEPSVESAAEAVRLGAFDYLPKPLRRDTLVRVCGHALRHKQLLDEKARIETEKDLYRRDLDLLFTSVSEGIALVGSDLRVLRVNDAFARIVGTRPETLLEQGLAQALGSSHPDCSGMLRQVMETGKEVRELRVEGWRGDGSHQAVIVNITPLFEKSRGFTGAALLLRDITRQVDLEKQLEQRCSFHRLTGKSKKMQEIYGLLEALAATDTTVLVTGESGTGKELVAEAIHYASARAQQPLVKVNCSALSENLLESELFGHSKGAFTGADRDRVGRFQMAQGGTILLDEIGDIAPRLQIKLLRVLQEKEFERVGDATPVKADVRIIAATNSNLPEKIKRGDFRSDLYYRLKVVEIDLPPLRERLEDLPLLVDEFCREHNATFRKAITGVSEEALGVLVSHSWPGNIRELKHVLEHAFVLCRDTQISLAHLPVYLLQEIARQQETVFDSLVKAGGNKSGAARLMGVSRQTVYRKMKRQAGKKDKPA